MSSAVPGDRWSISKEIPEASRAHLRITRTPEEIQQRLSRLNAARLHPTTAPALALPEEIDLRQVEAEFIEAERRSIEELLGGVPDDAGRFLTWFIGLRESGPGQGDPLFPWLAEKATAAQMAWFITQEVAGEAGFDDLVALTQLKMPVQAKLEMARNYWDEMGRGRSAAMHGPMLDRLATDWKTRESNHEVTWESLAVGNLLAGLAANRHYAYEAIGALGVIELTAPGRAALVNRGLMRLGAPAATRKYYALHATIDIRHSLEWNREVIEPIVRDRPAAIRHIATGALLRLNAGARCFARYRREFGLKPLHPAERLHPR